MGVGKIMVIHILKCGSTIVDEALPLSSKSKNPLAYTGIGRSGSHKIEVPVTAYLIEHPKGLVLVDTGWDTKLREDARKYEGFANNFASPGFLPEGQAVTEHLERLGYAPKDIDYCILTHLDIDHAGGLRLVKNAKRIMASEAEAEAAKKHHVRYRKCLWKDVTIETFPNIEYDLFQDGTILLKPLPGHSAGMTGVKVQNNGKYAVIAGDAGYCRQSWEQLVLPGITWRKESAKQSLRWLQAASKDPDCVAILATHDREGASEVIEL